MVSPVTLESIPSLAEKFGGSLDSEGCEIWSRISIWKGDITTLKVDAIANAADEVLSGGGGVDGAIHKAAGPQLAEACRKLVGCETGKAKITPGFNLPAKYVIHTVGPIGEKPGLLASAYYESLDLAAKKGVRSIAFPCISTGVFGYPARAACIVAVQTVLKWIESHTDAIDRVVFCMFNDRSIECYEETTERLLAEKQQQQEQ
ncbi:O-acetyl-ADP-ribose deacetylase macrod2 [Coemansia sp. RSA 2399]|nr:O-acetyl-ADP-ribose deacetylase macrod2 [Coemansia sp. RSA 2399]KAJ1906804.1 O-acetyl-ADP-ribose deacetylase macrod2 [Coemansia sp. IMI 209127]